VPLISVVIPAYNGGDLLCQAVDSVLAQTMADFELIVVDDGSTDGSAQRLPADDRLVLIRQRNTGTAAARNAGIAAATGEWVALLDQDDRWYPDKLERQLPYLTGDVDLAHSGADFVDAAGRVTSTVHADPALDVHALLSWCQLVVQTALIRRTVLAEVGGFDQELSGADDWDLWVRIADHHRLRATPDVLAAVTVHPANQSNDAELMFGAARRLIRKHRRLHPGCWSCRRARARASWRNRAEYYGRLRGQARTAAAAGRRLQALWLTCKALYRHPGALIDTPRHYRARARSRP
jgi:GT2 family glycosyltransferase